VTDIPASHTRPLDAASMVLVVFICLAWGFNQPAVKLALPDVPPLIQCASLATVIVLGIMRLRGLPVMARDGTLAAGLVAGVLFGLEFLMIYRGLLYTTASRAVLFIYLAPFFVVLGARIFLPADRFNLMQWAGLVLAFGGMIVAFGVPAPASSPHQLLGDLMMALAALFWAATTLVIKASSLSRVSPEKTLLYQLVVCVPIVAFGALAFGERMTAMPSGPHSACGSP
jgi:drug/metabolite transporter (DMT)-like permease